MTAAAPTARVFRLPTLTYLVVLFLFFGTLPIAFAATGDYGANAQIGIRTVALVIPVLALLFVARTSTRVDGTGITVRAPFGSRAFGWDEIRGLSVRGNTVYAELEAGAVRLPCVRFADLAAVGRASGGRVPQLPDPTPKHPPARRRRR